MRLRGDSFAAASTTKSLFAQAKRGARLAAQPRALAPRAPERLVHHRRQCETCARAESRAPRDAPRCGRPSSARRRSGAAAAAGPARFSAPPPTRRREVAGGIGDQQRAGAMQLAPEQRAQQRPRAVAVQDDGVGPKTRQRRADAGVVDMEAGALERRRLGQEFMGIAAGEIGRPGERASSSRRRRSCRARRGWRRGRADLQRRLARQRPPQRRVILDRMRDDDREPQRAQRRRPDRPPDQPRARRRRAAALDIGAGAGARALPPRARARSGPNAA